MKLSGNIVLSWQQSEICIIVYVFYVNICLNKKSFVQQNLKITLNIKKNENLQSERKKLYLTRLLLKLKMLNTPKLSLELLVAILQLSQTSLMEHFVKIVSSIKLFEWVLEIKTFCNFFEYLIERKVQKHLLSF